MQPIIKHPWNISEPEALKLQLSLADRVVKKNKFTEIQLVAGVDVAYAKESNQLVAAIVILDAETLEVIETVTARDTEQFPYISGLFSFRELPPIIKAFDKIKNKPHLIICDGQGYAHPRRFGLACHLGVIFDVPTIGCGKTRLLGKYTEPGQKRGSASPLVDNGEIIGNALRTQNQVNPVFISIGHRVSLETACEWVLKLAPKYRLPETTRKSDQAVKCALKTIS